MRKKIFLFNLILTILLALNSNLVYSEPNESKEGEFQENGEGEPYRKLEDVKKELKEERHRIDQQRLDDIRKKEEEKKANEIENGENIPEKTTEEKKTQENKKENELIPKLIVRLRGKHSTKYLCSYNFTITNENTESELASNNYDDYTVLLKKSSLKVRPGELINFEFSEKPKNIRAFIWGDEITELEMTRGSIRVPNYDKKIVVGIEGTYKNGKILYAVVLDIRG